MLTSAEIDCLFTGRIPTEEEVAEAMKSVIGLPFPEPESWHEVQENRVAALRSGALPHHYFPAIMPTPRIWEETLRRLAICENIIGRLEEKIDAIASNFNAQHRNCCGIGKGSLNKKRGEI